MQGWRYSGGEGAGGFQFLGKQEGPTGEEDRRPELLHEPRIRAGVGDLGAWMILSREGMGWALIPALRVLLSLHLELSELWDEKTNATNSWHLPSP